MKLIRHKTPLFVATLMILLSTGVAADETARPAPETSQGVVDKVEQPLERAAKATESGIKRGAQATAHGIEIGVTAAEKGILRGAKATENAVHKVADKITGSSAKPSSEKASADEPSPEK